MKNRDFVILCLRLLGIYFLIYGLGTQPNIAALFIESHDLPLFLYMTPNIFIICGIILYFLAPKLSNFIITYSGENDGHMSISPSEETARIAFLILGIYILAYALPELIRESINFGIYYSEIEKIPPRLRDGSSRWTYLIAPVIRIVISFFLIFGQKNIIRFLLKHDSTFKEMEPSNQSLNSDG